MVEYDPNRTAFIALKLEMSLFQVKKLQSG